MTRIVVVGEGMLELSRGDAGWRLGHGGDTLNTAIHLARFGRDVAYFSALGEDPFSAGLRADWAAEGLDVSLVLTDAARGAGLYAITTDEAGERSFTYWRSDSAARRMFALPDSAAALAQAGAADLIFFSLITLAILPPEGRAALLDLCRRVRARGGRVAFDTNYRPRLWPDVATARAAHAAALAVSDIGLPTLEDEAALIGLDDAAAIRDHWRAAGVGEVIVKQGAAGCLAGDTLVAPAAALRPVDTSGAGDAFNAGYLHARLAGAALAAAAQAGHALAGWAIMQRGAIPPAMADAPYNVA